MPIRFVAHRSCSLAALAALLSGACGEPAGGSDPVPLPQAGSLTARILAGEGIELLGGRPALLPPVPEGLSFVLRKSKGSLEDDPICYLRRPAGLNYVVHSIKSYPGGSYRVRTNAFGMREDEEVSEVTPDLRVLVSGDSHTDGVVANADSFANVLEALLAERDPSRTVDVLNAGVGNTTFPHYLGTLVKYLPLEPDVFICAVYGGNDFGLLPTLTARLFETKLEVPPAEYWGPLGELDKLSGVGVLAGAVRAQIYNQRWRLAFYPEEQELSLELALDYVREMQRICEQRGMRLILVYLPSADEVEPELLQRLVESFDEHLGFDEGERTIMPRLVQRFLSTLEAEGVEVLDTRPVLRAAAGAVPTADGPRDRQEPLFWREDLHLARRGHRLVGEALAERIP